MALYVNLLIETARLINLFMYKLRLIGVSIEIASLVHIH